MTQLKHNLLKMALLIMSTTAAFTLHAQDWKSDKKINILFGLAQPLVAKGFNIEGNYIYNRLIFDYSHGASLDYTGNLLPKDLRNQQIAIHEPWTTGFGVGYRIKEWINVRVEPKWHKFEYYYEGEPQTDATLITSYRTFSLGLGIYGAYQPFKKKNNYLKGFLISPSVRYWPTVSSSLGEEGFTYTNKKTGGAHTLKTLDPGTNFSPWVFNISIGYSFQLNKKS